MLWWVIWLIIAVGLAIAELHSGDFTLLMLAGGGLAGMVAAIFIPVFWIQAVVAAISAALLLWALRPTLLRHVRSMPGYRSSLDRMIGSTGVVTQAITAEAGEVKIDGEVWSARSLTGAPIALEEPVDVYEIDGTYLMVVPRSQMPPSFLPGPMAAPGLGTPPAGPLPPLLPPVAGAPQAPPQPGYLGVPPSSDAPDFWARPQG